MVGALGIIKAKGPISADDLAKALGITEKQARGRIDRLRKSGEPIWRDRQRGFWWMDDRAPSGLAHVQWKRDKE